MSSSLKNRKLFPYAKDSSYSDQEPEQSETEQNPQEEDGHQFVNHRLILSLLSRKLLRCYVR